MTISEQLPLGVPEQRQALLPREGEPTREQWEALRAINTFPKAVMAIALAFDRTSLYTDRDILHLVSELQLISPRDIFARNEDGRRPKRRRGEDMDPTEEQGWALTWGAVKSLRENFEPHGVLVSQQSDTSYHTNAEPPMLYGINPAVRNFTARWALELINWTDANSPYTAALMLGGRTEHGMPTMEDTPVIRMRLFEHIVEAYEANEHPQLTLSSMAQTLGIPYDRLWYHVHELSRLQVINFQPEQLVAYRLTQSFVEPTTFANKVPQAVLQILKNAQESGDFLSIQEICSRLPETFGYRPSENFDRAENIERHVSLILREWGGQVVEERSETSEALPGGISLDADMREKLVSFVNGFRRAVALSHVDIETEEIIGQLPEPQRIGLLMGEAREWSNVASEVDSSTMDRLLLQAIVESPNGFAGIGVISALVNRSTRYVRRRMEELHALGEVNRTVRVRQRGRRRGTEEEVFYGPMYIQEYIEFIERNPRQVLATLMEVVHGKAPMIIASNGRIIALGGHAVQQFLDTHAALHAQNTLLNTEIRMFRAQQFMNAAEQEQYAIVNGDNILIIPSGLKIQGKDAGKMYRGNGALEEFRKAGINLLIRAFAAKKALAQPAQVSSAVDRAFVS